MEIGPNLAHTLETIAAAAIFIALFWAMSRN